MTLFQRALQDLGTKEIPGPSNNPKIMKFLQTLDSSIKEETTAWCSAALNYWANDLQLPRSKSLAARSWLKIGTKTDAPSTITNSIAILWRVRPDSWQGHVGVYLHHNKESVWLLGGNQGDKVSIQEFPIAQVLEFRKLS